MARRTLGQTVARQQLEIEGYKKDLEKQRDEIGRLRAENETLSAERDMYRRLNTDHKQEASWLGAQVHILRQVIMDLNPAAARPMASQRDTEAV